LLSEINFEISCHLCHHVIIETITTKRPHKEESMPKKIDQEIKDQIISMYVSGLSAPQIAEKTGVKLTTIKRIAERNQLGQLRRVSGNKAVEKITDLVAESKIRRNSLDLI
jgi:IS30 family transposase